MALEVGSGLTIGLILGTVIVVAAMLIWVERRLLSFWQERLGPNGSVLSGCCRLSLT